METLSDAISYQVGLMMLNQAFGKCFLEKKVGYTVVHNGCRKSWSQLTINTVGTDETSRTTATWILLGLDDE